MEAVNKPDILEVVARKASARLQRRIRVEMVDISAKPASSGRMEQLLSFGRAHSDIVTIKNQ